MISNTVLRHATRCKSTTSKIINTSLRSYVSRAHPTSFKPSFPVESAIEQVLEGVEQRKVSRVEKWERNKEKRAEKGIKDDGPYRNQDETLELSLCLNLDPQRPGQALRGSLPLPHGTGKKVNVLVFCSDDDKETIAAAKDAGATVVGGSSVIQSISSGELAVNFDRSLATPDMMPSLSKVARILGPRGLMPNAKLGTIQPAENLAEAVTAQASGMVQYRTDKFGNIMAGIGKGSFQKEQLLENIRSFMNAIQSVKPESFGKGKKKGKNKSSTKNTKFYLKAYLTSTQHKGSVNIDLRSLDPTSSYFMATPPQV
mmetsp:Transcript_12562/g.15930  ORF Transcript_12562/g.15930 Transcript_12562/m.15930 type:complete len:314 (+) Transcript_12562:19-960(+)